MKLFHVKQWTRQQLFDAWVGGARVMGLYDALPPPVRDAYKDYHPMDSLSVFQAAEWILNGAVPELVAKEIRRMGEAACPAVQKITRVSRETRKGDRDGN